MSTLSFWVKALVPGLSPLAPDYGSAVTPKSVTGVTLVHTNSFSVANNATQIVLNIPTDLASFKFLIIESDQIVSLEIQGAVAASNSNVKLAALIPFILAQNYTRVYSASGNFAGADDTITKITIKNASGNTAIIKVLAFN